MIKYNPKPSTSKGTRPIELKDFRRQQTIENEFGDPLFRQISLSTDVSLAWRNLRYEIPEKMFSKQKKVILRRLTGQVKYGSLNGFMGPSGAGKTTLLSCLNGNIRQLAEGSEIYINDEENKYPSIGFIEQHVHETIVGGLTISEVLYYAFRFKNRFQDRSKLNEHVKNTLEELMLDPTILERRFNQCSGGEQKRIAIAQELMSLDKPTFLFIDEPTTGLDSQAALIVMQCLRRLATNYRITMMVSIHMPNDEIIRQFDQLYILAKGGICIYAGRREYLRNNLRQRLGMEIELGKPPIEEYLKIACNGIEDRKVLKLADYTLMNENEKLRPHKERLRYLPTGMKRQYKTFSLGDFLLQLIRLCYIILVVEFRMIIYQLFCYVIFFAFISTIFNHDMVYQSTCYSYSGLNITCQEMMHQISLVNSYINFQASYILFISNINITIGAILFTPLLKIFRNEHQNRWYSMSTFYWSFITIRFFEMSAFSLVITALSYFPTEHHYIDSDGFNWFRFAHFALFIWLFCFCMQSWGQLLSLIFVDHLEISMIIAIIIYFVLSLVNGYLVNLIHMENSLLIFVSDVFGTKYITNGLLYSFLGLDRCDLEKNYSLKMNDFKINPDTIYSDLIVVIINIVILRIFSFILMYTRFSRGAKVSKLKQTNNEWLPIQIDSKHQRRGSSVSNITNITDALREKDMKEIKFEEFSKGKIIVGWRSLTLFGSTSIKEVRSVKSLDDDSKIILRDLNGQFRFGTLNALMGTSGAGKTSFLKVLNGRSKTRLSDNTEIYLSKYTPIRICYLTQEVSGHLWPGLTAKQSLIYASKLKNSFEDQHVDHEKIAWTLLEELDITDTADTMALNCSGGEKKRLALALELTPLRMPNFICIDEPTSGLDSNSADIVITCLRRLVHRHNSMTIVASIHQPSTEMLMLFDYCYMLARGGICIYSGVPNNIPQQLIEVPEIGWSPETDNFPVEELIKCSCQNHKDEIVQKLAKMSKKKIFSFDNELMECTQKVMDGIQMNRIRFSLKSVWLLSVRQWTFVRNHLWIYLIGYYLLYIIYAIISRSFFHHKIAYNSGCMSLEKELVVCNRTSEEIEREIDLTSNIRYSLFFNCFFLFLVMLQAALFFHKESIYFFNEHRNGWYSTGAYYTMKSLTDFVPMILILFPYVYLVNIYEQVRPGIFWWFYLVLFLSSITAQGVGHMVALLTTAAGNFFGSYNFQTTLLTTTVVSFFFLLTLMANFFNPIKEMHYIYQMLSNLSFLRFAHESIILLQYGFGRCGKKEIQVVLYYMMIDNDEYFYHCLQMIIYNMIFYRLLALMVLIHKSNPIENRRQRAQQILKFHQDELKPSNAIIPGLSSHVEFTIRTIEMENQAKADVKNAVDMKHANNEDKELEFMKMIQNKRSTYRRNVSVSEAAASNISISSNSSSNSNFEQLEQNHNTRDKLEIV